MKWTRAAKEGLKGIPPKVREGLIKKIDQLYECEDQRIPNKPLIGTLLGYFRVSYSRYHAVYSVEEEHLANGDILVKSTILVVAIGKRKEHDKHDIYRLAQKLVEMGVIDTPEVDDEDGPSD